MAAIMPLLPLAANAEARNDAQALRVTRRIAIIAPFFCSGPMQKPLPPRKDAASKDSKPVVRVALPDKSMPSIRKPHSNKDLPPAAVKIEPPPKRVAPVPTHVPPATNMSTPASTEAFYRDALKSLTEVMGTSLPDRLTEGGRFTVVPAKFVQQALRGLHWQARDLFLPSGSGNAKFPTPDTERLQQLARKLHVDAVFVGTMREPASIGDGLRLPFEMWRINPLDLGIKRTRAHVLSPRVRAFLVTAQGGIAWEDEQMADHPRTTPHTTRTLLVDWQEATEQVAQQLADSLHALSGDWKKELEKGKG
jgi:hypothetical protein